jgi:outer membrane receptor for ferrienterochelin and colicins
MRVRYAMWGVLFVVSASTALAQTATVRVEVRAEAGPVADADVFVNGVSHRTDINGKVVVMVPSGTAQIVVVKAGFAPASASVDVQAGQEQPVIVDLTTESTMREEVTVSAARTDKRLEDVPMRVEVLSADEIEEKVMMTPGDIVMMLNEMGGLRVQATSPSLGAASIRIQGMRGRYTRFLSDGLPLFGQQVGGLGLLQIPPTDLGQVEVIKGVASALYGAGAMGGVVNLVSRRPMERPSQDVLVNRSSRGATDAVAFLSAPFKSGWGGTLLGGGHWQQQNDINGDGWVDLPGYNRGELRPRLFWDDHTGKSFFATAGATWETRHGGTVSGAVLPTTHEPYQEALDTGRFDVGVVGQTLLSTAYVLTARASAAWQHHDHRFGDIRERDIHDTAFGELSVRRHVRRQTWVVGVAVERDAFDAQDLPQFSYTFTTPGTFLQDDVDVTHWLSLSASGRLDHHSRYGTFFSPRVSTLVRAGRWTSRISAGTGFYPSTPLTEETEAAGLSRLNVKTPLRAETGESGSVDVTRTNGPLSYTATFFASRVRNPVRVERVSEYLLANLSRPTTNVGTELLATWRRAPLTLTANYAFVRAREFDETGFGFADVPLTPKHALGVVGMWEREGVGRVGLEWYYTGRQRLEANPFRGESEPYALFGLLIERVFGPVRLFVNGENLGNVRQTQWDPLIRAFPGVDGRWTVDAWAPLDGRNVNGGIRVRF